MAGRWKFGTLAAVGATLSLLVYGLPSAFAAPVIPDGTVMVSTGNGMVSEFDQDGNLLGQLDTGTGSYELDGSGFDTAGNFIATAGFNANQVAWFDPTGALLGPFGSGYNCDPESVTFDSSGNVYIGQADCSHQVLEFDSNGTPIATFSPATEDRGSDWIEMQADQCTLLYTSEDANVKRFNVCTDTQLPDFNTAPLPGTHAYSLRTLLPFQYGAGGVLVADTDRIVRLDSTGAQVQTYTMPGATILFPVSLDPDGTSFWTADYLTGEVYKVDIKTGTILKSWSAASAPGFAVVGGLSVKGELIPSVPPPDCSNAAASKAMLWPPNHKFVSEKINGVTAVNGPVSIDITGITQDEPTLAKGSGHTCPDGKGIGSSTAKVRAERAKDGNGRVYHIAFTATDANNKTCSGEVQVCVPHDHRAGVSCIDGGPLYDSTTCH